MRHDGLLHGASKLGRPLVAIATLAVALYMAPARDGTGYRTPTASITAPNGVSPVHPAITDRLYALNAAR